MDKYKMLDKSLLTLAYSYLAIPVVIWLFFWFKWYISVPAILMLLISIIFALKKTKYKTEEEYKSIFDKKKITILIILILIICVLSGAGGIFFQNWDYNGRNAIFHDLIDKDWPVKYDYSNLPYEENRIESSEGILSYYFAFWLPSAAIGKLTNFTIASISQLIWQIIGVILFFYLVCRKMNKVKLKYYFIFFAFGGLDVIGQIIINLMNHNWLAPIGVNHIDTWNGSFVMSTFVTQLFWVFNQSLPAWIVTMLLVNEKEYGNLGLLVALLLPFGPFPTIGLILWCGYLILFGFDLKSFINLERIKKCFSISNILGVISVVPIGLIYMQNTSEKGCRLVDMIRNVGFSKTMLLYILFLVLEFGIYFIIINKENRRKVLAIFSLLAILPLFYIGGGLDLGNRATIPILVLLYIEIIKFMDSDGRRIRKFILVGILLIAFCTNFNEIYRSIYNTIHYKETLFQYTDSYKTFAQFEGKECDIFIRNFVAPYNSINPFYKYIFK